MIDSTSQFDQIDPQEKGHDIMDFLDKHYMDGSQAEVEDPQQERVEYFEEVTEDTPDGPETKLKKLDVPADATDEEVEKFAAKKIDRVFIKRIDGEPGKTLELKVKHGFTERTGDDESTRHQYETLEFEKDFKANISTGFGAQELSHFRTGITRSSKQEKDGGTITSWGDGHLPEGWAPEVEMLRPMTSEELDAVAKKLEVTPSVEGAKERFNFGNGIVVFREKKGNAFHIHGTRSFSGDESPETALRLPMVSLQGPSETRERVDCMIRVNRVEINLDPNVTASRGRVKFSVEGQTPEQTSQAE